jgi:hypothetical protein
MILVILAGILGYALRRPPAPSTVVAPATVTAVDVAMTAARSEALLRGENYAEVVLRHLRTEVLGILT